MNKKEVIELMLSKVKPDKKEAFTAELRAAKTREERAGIAEKYNAALSEEERKALAEADSNKLDEEALDQVAGGINQAPTCVYTSQCAFM